MKRLGKLLGSSALVLALLGASATLQARDLTIALKTEPTAMDPLFHALTPNLQLGAAIFDPLLRTDKDAKAVPALAESWSVDGDVWTFKLRPNVTFSDGSPFTADDVVFTYERAPLVPNSPSSMALFLNKIASMKVVDPLTLEITTKGPAPTLPVELAQVSIMSHIAAAGPAPEGKTTVELNRGEGMAGTGPFKFVSWKRGAEIVLERNPDYWGPKPEWDRVIYRPISNPAARVAALRSGNVDLIEDPPTDDIAKLRADRNLHVQETPSLRIIYVALNQGEEVPNGMSGTGDKNPLTDRRVREALSLAIDRNAIADRVMGGVAQPAGNLLAYPGFGASEELTDAQPADPDKARQLLAEAGYPDGFSLLLGAPDGRYVNDKDLAQVIASMWSRIGVKTQVETMAASVFFQKRGQYAFSAFLAGWAVTSGEMINPLTALVLTNDKERGLGSTNWAHYSNPELDDLVVEAAATLDDAKREKMLQDAAAQAMADYAILPIHYEYSVWAMKKDVRYAGRADQATWPQDVTSAD